MVASDAAANIYAPNQLQRRRATRRTAVITTAQTASAIAKSRSWLMVVAVQATRATEGGVRSELTHRPESDPAWSEWRLDGPLKLGAKGMLNTKSGGKHGVVVTQYEEGRSFELESTALPGTKMAIRATIAPNGNGSRITQGFEPRGVLAPLVAPMGSGQ